MAKVLLQQPQPVTGIIYLDSVNSEGIPQAMRTDSFDAAGFGVNQIWQPGFSGAVANYLPRPVAVDAEDKPCRAISLDEIPQHLQCLTI